MTKTILLVDDTETMLMFERTMLKGSGFLIRVAHNGNQALEEVQKARPDLILLDIMMPELDGIETCRRLKGDAGTNTIPVVMVTTKGEPEMVEKAFQAGCNDYITKPLDKMELLAKVTTYLG
jgi:CheY-like chemotaxis protein